MEIRGDIALLIVAAAIVIVGIHSAITSNLDNLSHHDKGPNGIIEGYVNACWMAKLAKNLNDCKIHIAFIQNQCETNLNYSKAIACKDPRIAQMVKEEHELAQ
ncbi:MAG: hypothetical protein ACREBB_04885 [Nitrosotalea sp.]